MWGEGKKCAVLLCFDFDAESMWTDAPAFMSRGTYGARVGVPRILSLLGSHGIRATFFVPADTAERHPDVVQEIHAQGHEIGHHGDRHECPSDLALDEERRVLERGLEVLEKITGERPRGYRAPEWELSPNTLSLLQAYGFLYDSSLMADDFQLYRPTLDGQEINLVEIPVSWELDDAPYFLFNFEPYYAGMSAPGDVYHIWGTEFNGAYAHKGVFVLTMHPQIIGRYHRIKLVESLLHTINDHPGVWFATGTEVATAWLERERTGEE